MSDALNAKIRAKDCAPYSCLPGLKNFCACTGLDYQVFLSEGYTAEELLSFGDIQADRVVSLVLRDREAANGR